MSDTEHTPLYERASHATDDGGHTSYVFHRDFKGREVAIFVDRENHKVDAQLFIAAPDLLSVAELGATMRACQNAYFKNRFSDQKQDYLIASKQAEKAFDDALKAALAKVEGAAGVP